MVSRGNQWEPRKNSDGQLKFLDYQQNIMGINHSKYALNFKFPIITH